MAERGFDGMEPLRRSSAVPVEMSQAREFIRAGLQQNWFIWQKLTPGQRETLVGEGAIPPGGEP